MRKVKDRLMQETMMEIQSKMARDKKRKRKKRNQYHKAKKRNPARLKKKLKSTLQKSCPNLNLQINKKTKDEK